MSDVPALDAREPVSRQHLHTRRIELNGYRRADGLYDIEGTLVDTKTYARMSNGIERRAGDPVHRMFLRLTLGTDFVIRDALAESLAVPYPGFCETIGPEYKRLIGMTLKSGFMRETRAMFGGTRGCTHLTELIGGVATAAFQTMAAEVNASDTNKPFQLDGCHALRTDGPAVEAFYPKWYRAPTTIE